MGDAVLNWAMRTLRTGPLGHVHLLHRRPAHDVLEVDDQAVRVAQEEVLIVQRAVGLDRDGQVAVFARLRDAQDPRGRAGSGSARPPARAPRPRPRARRGSEAPPPRRPGPARAPSGATGTGTEAVASWAGALEDQVQALVLRVDLVRHQAGEPHLDAREIASVRAGQCGHAQGLDLVRAHVDAGRHLRGVDLGDVHHQRERVGAVVGVSQGSARLDRKTSRPLGGLLADVGDHRCGAVLR